MNNKKDLFWMSSDDYRKHVSESTAYYSDKWFEGVILGEIAVNLHEIAKQLAEMNGKKPPEEVTSHEP